MERKSALFGSITVVSVITIVLIFAVLLTSQRSDSITINEFLDDLVDRNDDGKIELEDAPFDFASYEVGDNITIRDRISIVYFYPDSAGYVRVYNETTQDYDLVYTGESENGTVISVNYTGKYDIRPNFIPNRISLYLEGNQTEMYHVGDLITLEVTITDRVGTSGETFVARLADD